MQSISGLDSNTKPRVRQIDINLNIQDEIDDLYESNDGADPSYNQIMDLEYLDMVFHETLRRHPAVGVMQRACTEDYTIPDSNVRVKKGEDVFINSAGIHSDPDFYPDPEKFDPEHFSKEAKANRHP